MRSALSIFGWVLAGGMAFCAVYFYQQYGEATTKLDELVTECAGLLIRIEEQGARNNELDVAVTELSAELAEAQVQIEALLRLVDDTLLVEPEPAPETEQPDDPEVSEPSEADPETP